MELSVSSELRKLNELRSTTHLLAHIPTSFFFLNQFSSFQLLLTDEYEAGNQSCQSLCKRFDVFVLELEELFVPKPLLWEWLWLLSTPVTILGKISIPIAYYLTTV